VRSGRTGTRCVTKSRERTIRHYAETTRMSAPALLASPDEHLEQAGWLERIVPAAPVAKVCWGLWMPSQ